MPILYEMPPLRRRRGRFSPLRFFVWVVLPIAFWSAVLYAVGAF